MNNQDWIVMLLMLAAQDKRRARWGSVRAGGPWPPGEDNLGTQPVPDGKHPAPAKPPLK
jgi:hypothetical protein